MPAPRLRLVGSSPPTPARPRAWPTETHLRKLLAAHAQLAKLVQRRPDLASHLRLPLDRLWSEVPSVVREKVRAVARTTAPGVLVLMPSGGPTIGQDAAAPVDDLRQSVRDWADHLGRATQTAENLWRAARAMQTGVSAAAVAASANPDAALDAAGQRLREAASFTGWGLGIIAVGVLAALVLWKS